MTKKVAQHIDLLAALAAAAWALTIAVLPDETRLAAGMAELCSPQVAGGFAAVAGSRWLGRMRELGMVAVIGLLAACTVGEVPPLEDLADKGTPALLLAMVYAVWRVGTKLDRYLDAEDGRRSSEKEHWAKAEKHWEAEEQYFERQTRPPKVALQTNVGGVPVLVTGDLTPVPVDT